VLGVFNLYFLRQFALKIRAPARKVTRTLDAIIHNVARGIRKLVQTVLKIRGIARYIHILDYTYLTLPQKISITRKTKSIKHSTQPHIMSLIFVILVGVKGLAPLRLEHSKCSVSSILA
jgi:hypothetical protein